jgi:TonB-dependent SusC/RagA subfamily outer membrane receptor
MKNLIFLSILAISLSFAGCSTTGSVTDSEKKENPRGSISEGNNNFTSLADFLYRVPGVNVSGSGDNVRVIVRGVNSFTSNITPLYVIDGTSVGYSYSRVNSMLSPKDIDYIRVLKDAEAATYGVRGGTGVVLIKTKGSNWDG